MTTYNLESLTFDTYAENSANVALPLMPEDGSIAVIEHQYPAPPMDLLTASSVDTEGERVASRTTRNRSIALTVECMGGSEAAGTNRATNPRAASGTTGWTNNSLTTFERVTASSFPAGNGYADTAIHAAGNATADAAYLSAAVTNGTTIVFSADVYVVSGTVRLEAWNATPALSTSGSSITAGSWQRVSLTVPVNSTATWTFRVAQSAAGTSEFYVTRVLITTNATGSSYFDGDTPGCSWSGTAHASTSSRPAGGATRLHAILRDLEAKVATLMRSGGTLTRQYANGNRITFDVLAAESYEPRFDIAYYTGNVAQVSIGLLAEPFGRGAEETLSSHSETTLPVLIFTETGLKGDVLAWGRIKLTEGSGVSQYRVWWGIQSRYYSSAATAALFYQAESLTLGTGASTADATASGGTMIRDGSVPTLLASTVATLTGTHIGTFRLLVRARCPTTNAGTTRMRAVWTVGGSFETENEYVEVPEIIGNKWSILDLGMVTIPELTLGTQTWSALLKVIGTSAGDDIDIDWVMLLPTDEGSGLASGPTGSTLSVPPSVLKASLSAEIRYDGYLNETSSGQWGAPEKYEGDYVFLPPAGPEARTLRVIVKASAAAITPTYVGDNSIDDISAQITYTPRYLVVPDA